MEYKILNETKTKYMEEKISKLNKCNNKLFINYF